MHAVERARDDPAAVRRERQPADPGRWQLRRQRPLLPGIQVQQGHRRAGRREARAVDAERDGAPVTRECRHAADRISAHDPAAAAPEQRVALLGRGQQPPRGRERHVRLRLTGAHRVPPRPQPPPGRRVEQIQPLRRRLLGGDPCVTSVTAIRRPWASRRGCLSRTVAAGPAYARFAARASGGCGDRSRAARRRQNRPSSPTACDRRASTPSPGARPAGQGPRRRPTPKPSYRSGRPCRRSSRTRGSAPRGRSPVHRSRCWRVQHPNQRRIPLQRRQQIRAGLHAVLQPNSRDAEQQRAIRSGIADRLRPTRSASDVERLRPARDRAAPTRGRPRPPRARAARPRRRAGRAGGGWPGAWRGARGRPPRRRLEERALSRVEVAAPGSTSSTAAASRGAAVEVGRLAAAGVPQPRGVAELAVQRGCPSRSSSSQRAQPSATRGSAPRARPRPCRRRASPAARRRARRAARRPGRAAAPSGTSSSTGTRRRVSSIALAELGQPQEHAARRAARCVGGQRVDDGVGGLRDRRRRRRRLAR